jgi:hypothetical protein
MNNTQLNTIETAFLNNAKVKTQINTTKIDSLNAEINELSKASFEASKNEFETSLKLAKLMLKAKDFIKSAEGKEVLKATGLTWTIEDLYTKVFNRSYSWGKKLVQAENNRLKDSNVKKAYLKASTEAEKNPSIEGFNKFCKKVANNGGDSEGVTVDEGKEKSLMTFTSNESENKVHARIDSQGNFKSPCDIDEVIKALESALQKAKDTKLKAKMGAGVNITAVDLS